ncbi:glycoside hydrolase family 3 N-terminal domain-containing protein [Agreia sp. Leaf283]|uniref:glycoside hydrolase family 3 N-terminal domain-containing protein n=1 Tax=Agreia sp. Leaf283 TaxID=1736321 RepID=UPI0007019FDD|nr:glycoside hydrolase family 3 N-terminal domain-containing protein [Agreia sp. Leaf283]KQP56012.1 glycoside hydrolase [Agreia sp. Leaf283]
MKNSTYALSNAPERAHELLGRMTLGEKCAQLAGTFAWELIKPDGSPADTAEQLLAAPPGHISQLILHDARQLADTVGLMQRRFVEDTRLGIPALFHAEALNGVLAGGHPIFPTAIGLAAGWNPALVERMADLTRREMIRMGLRHALSPVMDVAIDPRWGRVHETYGEDPYLVAALSVAYTRGLQGEELSSGVLATGKHFLGYAAPEAGMNSSVAAISPRRMRDVFAFPFEAAVHQAGLGSIMNTYADIDGIPVAASREILTDFLRGELGFTGFVSADYASIEHLVFRQGVARDIAEAARLAISAGLDVEFPKTIAYGQVLAGEVAAGRLDMSVVDESVLRVLEAKFRLGLFEQPYPTGSIDLDAVPHEGDGLSRELAQRSVVVLENDGILPLDPTGRRIAVVGPHANAPELQFAAYSYVSWRQAVEAIHLGGEMTMVGVDHDADAWHRNLVRPGEAAAMGRDRYDTKSLAVALADRGAQITVESGSSLTNDLNPSELARAVTAAADADLTIVALGGASLWFAGERTEGEASDTADISLPAAQTRLLEAVAATGTPFIVVLVQGRAYTLPAVVEQARAIVMSSFGGPYGASAIVDVLIGDSDPVGRLPYSIPKHVGQVPIYHHRTTGSGGRSASSDATRNGYLDLDAEPAYPFGYGLAFTSFELGDLRVPEMVSTDGEFTVDVPITNTGSSAGSTIVQLYLRSRVSGIIRPFQQLAGFSEIRLDPGASSVLRFTVSADQLAASGIDRLVAVEPGTLEVAAGFDSATTPVTAQLRVEGPRRVVRGVDRSFFSQVEILTDY